MHRASREDHLHSTMLLLYLRFTPIRSVQNTFTFHYASTLSFGWRGTCGHLSIFTFHYASTLSKKIDDAIEKKMNLHSTMLLLYQPYDSEGIMDNKFTFHYASTLSESEDK